MTMHKIDRYLNNDKKCIKNVLKKIRINFVGYLLMEENLGIRRI